MRHATVKFKEDQAAPQVTISMMKLTQEMAIH